MSKEIGIEVDISNTNPEYWENILANIGMPSKLPHTGTSLEQLQETEHNIKEGLDNAVVTENIFSSSIPLNKSGLAPCQRAKMEGERNYSTSTEFKFNIK